MTEENRYFESFHRPKPKWRSKKLEDKEWFYGKRSIPIDEIYREWRSVSKYVDEAIDKNPWASMSDILTPAQELKYNRLWRRVKKWMNSVSPDERLATRKRLHWWDE